jgi:formyl-CoA transferase
MIESLITGCDRADYIPERTGAILPDLAPASPYGCEDGMVLIAANKDCVFRRLVEAMGAPWLADDPRFSTYDARDSHLVELDRLVESWTRTMTVEAAIWLMNKFGVPVGRIYLAPDMLADEHCNARASIAHMPYTAPRWRTCSAGA